ncbi:sigma-54-dependent Fis family transcriptional regulator [candidate division KSB1 bacterium]|nr:sigma-54-dependent Fis family transcriptional regulator [candidate division KSB1 bacterium]
MKRLLIVDDERTARKGLLFMLQSLDLQVQEAENRKQAEKILQNQEFDLAIVDLRMPTESQGLGLIGFIHHKYPLTPILVMTAFGSIDSAVKATKAGAQDYMTKDFSRDEIILKIEKILETKQLWLDNLRLSEQINNLKGNLEIFSGQDQIIGDNPAIKQVLDLSARVGKDNESTVLITGESGTGKELIARSIHCSSSTRSREKFMVIDVANMPSTLLESQLFGHEKGSFTNAHQQHAGLFEKAHKGTVFLDEIGDFPKKSQVKLLRFIQEKVFFRVGSNEPISTDVRIIAATNKNLEEMVGQEKFREDLYYRLNVVRIHLPPLRERRDDIPSLVNYFKAKFETQKGRVLIFPENIIQKMIHYDWPGNIRQLKNFVERLYIACPGHEVQENDLMFSGIPTQAKDENIFEAYLKLPLKEARRQLTEKLEKTFLKHYLLLYKGNISKIATVVGESREGLSKKIKRYGLKE